MTKLRLLRMGVPLAARFPWFFYRLASVGGFVTWAVRRKARGRVVANLLPLLDGDRRQARRQSLTVFQNVARYYVDIATLSRRDMAHYERDHMQIVHSERLQLLNEPGPVILLSAHAGNPEMAVQALTFRGRPFTALVEVLEPPALGKYFLKLRSAAAGAFYQADLKGVRACVDALKRGGLIALVGDRDIQGSGVCVRLFDRAVKLPRGPFELARRTDALIMPVFCSRTGVDDMIVFVEEPMKVMKTSNAEQDVQEAAAAWARVLEAHLRREPSQWTVMEDFWKVHACGEG
jgi:phosphatidylinositol dimannoside acyltransferase